MNNAQLFVEAHSRMTHRYTGQLLISATTSTCVTRKCGAQIDTLAQYTLHNLESFWAVAAFIDGMFDACWLIQSTLSVCFTPDSNSRTDRQQTGNRQIGNRLTGNRQTGNRQTGYRQTGNRQRNTQVACLSCSSATMSFESALIGFVSTMMPSSCKGPA